MFSATAVHQTGCALGAKLIAGVPQFLRHNGFKVTFYQSVVLFRVVHALVVQEIFRVRPVVGNVAFIGGFAQYTRHLAGCPCAASAAVLASLCHQGVSDALFSRSCRIQFVDSAHRRRLFLVDNVALTDSVIAEDIAVSVQNPFFAADFLPRFHALTGFAALVLRNACHNCQANLAVAVHGPDAVIDKIDLHAVLLQLAGCVQGIYRVAGKAGQFAGHDQVKPALFCVLQHLHKRGALFHLRAGDALIDVTGHDVPVRIILRQLDVPIHLVAQRG